jgi:hypothetical protein
VGVIEIITHSTTTARVQQSARLLECSI